VVQGDLDVPADAGGIIVFAHGSGSSRHSPRNRYLAGKFAEAGFATLLFDMLAVEEDRGSKTRFDIGHRAQRVKDVLAWLGTQDIVPGLPVGLFGASTGAAAALKAASELGGVIHALVCRGGRTDLVTEVLARVATPTLLIVGGYDPDVIAWNQAAMHALPPTTAKRLRVVPRATHLFEEPGALDKVAKMSIQWFDRFCSNVRI
jgi:putative phosphoribosyl transferase